MGARTGAIALVLLVSAAAARAQTPAPGWILIVRMQPNPLPIGRCAGINEEVQDEHGYRRNELSNGGVIDFHKFRYDADTTNFQWQFGDPLNGALCARPNTPPSHVTVTITMPDGLSGSVELNSIPSWAERDVRAICAAGSAQETGCAAADPERKSRGVPACAGCDDGDSQYDHDERARRWKRGWSDTGADDCDDRRESGTDGANVFWIVDAANGRGDSADGCDHIRTDVHGHHQLLRCPRASRRDD